MAERTLFGRAHECDILGRLVSSLADGRGGSTFLVGEAGIGKTALAGVAIAAAAELGIRCLVTAGVPLTLGRPLQPILDALDGIDHDGGSRTLLEATVGDPVTLLLQRVIDRLDAMARDEPLLVVLEDLHWVDEATLTLLHHHITRADRRQLSMVATSRPPLPGTPLHHLVIAADSTVVEIGGLASHDVEALIAATLGDEAGDLDRSTLDAAAGNPLLVEAVVSKHRADSTYPRPATDGPTASSRPDRDPVAAIVRSVSPDVLSVLQVAAVAGNELRVDLLAAVTAVGVPQVVDRLERARSSGVIDVAGDGLVFRHALYRTAVVDTLPVTARQALHLEVARVLEWLGAPTLEIAEHVARGARPGNRAAVDQLTGAAEELSEIDPSTALRITDLALALSGRQAVPVRLQVVRVAGLAACGRSVEAEALGSELLRVGVAAEVEAKVRRELALAAFVAGRPADSEVHMSRVVELTTTPEAAARAVTEQAWARMLALDREGAWAGTHDGVRDGDASTRISAESLRCWLGLWRLDIDSATVAADHLEKAVEMKPRGDWQIFQPLLGAAAVRLEHEQFDRAIANAETGRRLATDAGSAWASSSYHALIASTAFRCGDFDQATTEALAALDGTAIIDSFGVEIWSRAVLAQIALRRGHIPLARHHVEAAGLAAEDGRAQLGIDQLVIAETGLHLADGDRAAAVKTLEDGWSFLSVVGIHFVRGIVGVELVKHLCAAGEQRDHIEAVAAEIDNDARTSGLPLLVGAAARARAWLGADAAAVHAMVDAAMASRNLLLRVDALSDALALAPADASARTWSTELDELLGRMGCLRTGAAQKRARARSVRPLFGPGALTDAERRVALLVAEGLTNARIAAQLVLSRRTVDSQVLAAYRKLGVSSRVGLTLALLADSAG